MADHTSVGSFTRAVQDYGKRLETSGPRAVNEAALLMKQSVQASLNAATGGDGKLRNVKGAKASVRYDIRGTHNPTALLKAMDGRVSGAGVWGMLEYGAKPHTIIPKGLGRSAGRGAGGRRAAKQQLYSALFGGRFAGVRPMSTPYGPRYQVSHPGFVGKHPFRTGVDRAKAAAMRRIQNRVLRDIRR